MVVVVMKVIGMKCLVEEEDRSSFNGGGVGDGGGGVAVAVR